MGKLGFREFSKLHGLVTYRLSSFHQQGLKGIISNGLPNWRRRISEEFLYVVPSFALAYLIYDQAGKQHEQLARMNLADDQQ